MDQHQRLSDSTTMNAVSALRTHAQNPFGWLARSRETFDKPPEAQIVACGPGAFSSTRAGPVRRYARTELVCLDEPG